MFGFLGTLRVAVAEHPIVNTHVENAPPDLRYTIGLGYGRATVGLGYGWRDYGMVQVR